MSQDFISLISSIFPNNELPHKTLVQLSFVRKTKNYILLLYSLNIPKPSDK